MSRRFVIAGTDTGVGKTVLAAALTAAIDGAYWKPVQCGGLAEGGDAETVRRLSGLGPERVLAETYRFRLAASPHIAAACEGVTIDPARLAVPDCARALVIEGAGGLMVPMTAELLQIDVLARWDIPVILVARTGLGTINHSLLSLEALGRRGVPVHGVAFVGAENTEVEATIARMGRVRRLGRLGPVAPLKRAALAAAFRAGFALEDFT